MNRAICISGVLALAACGTSARSRSQAVVTGDMCALHEDAVSCRAADGCAWYPNTRPCLAGDPACPAGWCYAPQALDGGSADGGVSVSAACVCPDATGDVCVMQIGGPATSTDPPPITCSAIPAGCGQADRCACLAQGSLEQCWASEQVSNLCVCDNGIR